MSFIASPSSSNISFDPTCGYAVKLPRSVLPGLLEGLPESGPKGSRRSLNSLTPALLTRFWRYVALRKGASARGHMP